MPHNTVMRYALTPQTRIEIRQGLRSMERSWNQIAFEYIGAKSADLAQVASDLEAHGSAVWNGFLLTHPEAEQ